LLFGYQSHIPTVTIVGISSGALSDSTDTVRRCIGSSSSMPTAMVGPHPNLKELRRQRRCG
ncbi:unnamed protein product, partial [Calicophoron daubneyi]